MEDKISMISIAVTKRDKSYSKVNDILHSFSENINLRVGHPIREKNLSIIFIVFQGTTDQLGALNGKLGQIEGIKVKSHTIKM